MHRFSFGRARILKTIMAAVVASLTIGAAETSARDHTTKSSKQSSGPQMAGITIRGVVPESAGELGLLGELQENLRQIVDRLDQAGADQNIDAVLLRIRNPILGRGSLSEITDAICRLRKSGKKVYASLQSPLVSDYLMASRCDAIIMPESGILLLPGVRVEVTYYRDLLDRLEIESDFMQVGDFKGAAEPFTRNRMSDDFRRQYESVLDDLYDQMIDTIAVNRGIDRTKVRELVDQALFTAQAAKEAYLIDGVAYEEDWLEQLESPEEGKTYKLVPGYGKKQIETNLSGMTGFLKILDLITGSKPRVRRTKDEDKRIAVVYATGTIVSGESTASLLGSQLLGSDTIIRALKKAEADETVVGVVLRVNSPGGSALASDLIWRQIQRMAKPVVASMGDVAASGGYYISMGCDMIIAEPGTLTGSIGVVGGKIALGKMLDKYGVTTEVLSRGANSGIISMHEQFNDVERMAWRGMLAETYNQFTAKAAVGRSMDPDRLKELAGGRIWTGRQAQLNGLVDEVGSLNDAIRHTCQLAGLPEDAPANLLILPEAGNLFDHLFGAAQVHMSQNAHQRADVLGFVRDAEALTRVLAEPAVMVLPYQIRIR